MEIKTIISWIRHSLSFKEIDLTENLLTK